MIKWIAAIALLACEVLLQDIEYGNVLINDARWIDAYSAFGTGITAEGQDFTSTATTTFKFGTHSSPFSFRNIDIVAGKIFIQKLVRNPSATSPAGLLYIVLHDTTIYVFNVNTANQYELRSSYLIPSSVLTTSYVCFDMIYLSSKVYIICNTGTATSMALINHNIVDLQTGVQTFTASSTRPLTAPRLVSMTLTGPTGATSLFFGVWNSLTTNDYLTTTHVSNTLTNVNYYVYLLNSTNGATTEKEIPMTNPHKLLSLTAYSRNLLVSHYRKTGTTIEGKAAVCTIPVDLGNAAITCQDLNTAYSLAAGLSSAVPNDASTGASLHYFDTVKNLVVSCTLSLSGFTTQADANCKSTGGAVDTTLKIEFDGFAWSDSEHATVIYKNTNDNTFVVADFVSRQSPQIVSHRRRFSDETYYTGTSENLIVGNMHRAVLVNSSSHGGLYLFKTTTAGAISDPISMKLLKDGQTISKTFRAQVTAITETVNIPTFGGIMNGTTGFHTLLPYSRSNIEGNQLTASATTTDGETLVILDNNALFDKQDSVTLDHQYLLGDALLGIVLNSSNATYIRYYSCHERLNTTINTTCTYRSQVEINGLAKYMAIRHIAIANGSITAASPIFTIDDRIVNMRNFKDHVVVHTRDNMTAANNHRLICFTKDSSTTSVHNFSNTYVSLTFTKFRDDLYVAAFAAAGYPVDVHKAASFELSATARFKQFEKTVLPNDLCAKAAQVYVMGYPRLRIISQCATGKEYAIEKDLFPSTTRGFMAFYSGIVENPALTTAINGCFIGNYYVYWEASKSKLYGIGGYQTDRMILDLITWIPGAITNWTCFGNSDVMAVMGLDASSKQVLIIVSVENMQAHYRMPYRITFTNAISHMTITDAGQSLYLNFIEGGVPKTRKLSLDGPYIFTNSSNNIQSKVTSKVENPSKTPQTETSIQFSTVTQSATSAKIKSTPVAVGTFNIEELFTIAGPVFSFSSSGFDGAKATFWPRVYANGSLSSSNAHSSLQVEGFVSVRVQYTETNTTINVYRDPETQRYSLNTEYYVDGPVGIIQDRIDYTAYVVAQGLNLTQRLLFVYRVPLVSSQFDLKKGVLFSDVKCSKITLRYIKQHIYQVAQYSKQARELILSIYDFSPMSTSWTWLRPSAKEINTQGKLI